ncbi:MAG: CotH kinase family protein [Prevotella sp.]|nr:CotH kinase family protein [Prevotella sp.]
MQKRKMLLLFSLTLCLCIHAQWQRKTNLPTVFINTFDGRSINSKTYYVYANMVYVDEESHVTRWDTIQIRGRGNSTWNMAKKPYRIKFLTKQRLLGNDRANAKNWTLLANAADKTLIRNALTSAMGEFVGLPFNPAYKFVDLVMNNTYLGTYQISDHIDIKKKRVHIEEQEVPLPDDADISGGYLLEVDGFQDGNWFSSSVYNVPIRIHSPDEDDIVEEQNLYIKKYIAVFENRLKSSTFDDPYTGYRQMVDSSTLVNWFLCTELSGNIDGYYSTYFYKDQADSLLYWGPLWDYDIAYNNDSRIPNTVNSLMTDVGYGMTKAWMRRMWEDPWFAKLVNRRYRELLDSGLVDYLYQQIDSMTTLLARSIDLNYEKWGIRTRVYHENVLYSSYDQYVTDLKDYITNHCDFLLRAFADKKPPEPTPPFHPVEYYYRITNANTAKAIEANGYNVTQFANMEDRETEDWIIRRTNGYFQLINRANELALNDPTIGDVGPTANVGTALNVAPIDTLDVRQLWQIVPQGTDGYYNLLNTHTQHVANLRGGSNSDGTAILSYTNDSRNGESKNRLWLLTPTKEQIPIEYTGIREVEPTDYALAYDPTTQELHFGSDTPESLTFLVHVYSSGGKQIGTFLANDRFPMAQHPRGIYIVTWQCGGKKRSVKFQK